MDASAPHPHTVSGGSTERSASDWVATGLVSTKSFSIACLITTIAATLFNTVDINGFYESGDDHLGVDGPVLIKLVIALAAGLIGVAGTICSRQVRQTLMTFPGLLLVAISVVFLLTSAVAFKEVATTSRVAAVINMGYVCFVPTVIVVLGMRRFVIACLCGLVINALANWGLYLLMPQYGIFSEELGQETFVLRMGGLGHPNAIGRTGVLAGLLSLALLQSSGSEHQAGKTQRPMNSTRPNDRQFGATAQPWRRLLWMSIIVLAVATAIAAFSRSAVLAGLVAAGMLLIDKLMTRVGIASLLAVIAIAMAGLIVVELASGKAFRGDSLTSMVTKTGDIEELTSATGRTAIWAEAVRLIAQRPLQGWGLNSTPKLMQDFSMHTHNLVLHATFSGGLIAGLLVLALLGWNLVFGLLSPLPLIRAISGYVLISAIFEDTVLDTFASPSTLLWFAVLIYPATGQQWLPGRRKAPFDSESDIESNALPPYTGFQRPDPSGPSLPVSDDDPQ
ncbi:O-Antigen ligase [Rubripirellula lacrimiformis]|uniref:O-Antigen ligase n=1 Tax=Rubripirellula lacrimiformis TaxID=1930273 RepID=A0A517N5X7_9BACT|nr:O-antigen ligase family protein [Rubripirellula lacrimiformis]QDT02547.1 O-Antigen ligase [Rubripirellula lacrimiformis]